MSDNLPIFVIGAGIAGLACARQLQQAGRQVIVLEAQTRIGGRIHSIEQDESVFDLGASWIHGIEDNPIWDMIQQYQIETKPFNYSSSHYYQKGQIFSSEQQELLEYYIHQVNNLLLESEYSSAERAVTEIINHLNYTENVWSEQELKLLLHAYFKRFANDPFATELSQLSAQFAKYEGYFSGDEVIFPKGYTQLVEHLAAGLEIKNNVEIVKIIRQQHSVELKTHDHQHYIGSAVVVALPLGVLKQNSQLFDPVLPLAYQKAIQKIGYGTFNKVFLKFDKPLPFSAQRIQDSISDFYWFNGQWQNILDLSEIYQTPTYLMLFGGKQAIDIDNISDSAVWHSIYASLNSQFESIPSQPKDMVVTRWGLNRYSYGSFSFPTPEHDAHLVSIFEQPIEHRLFFCGEHCSLNYMGTVHGAYLTGCKTAENLLRQQA